MFLLLVRKNSFLHEIAKKSRKLFKLIEFLSETRTAKEFEYNSKFNEHQLSVLMKWPLMTTMVEHDNHAISWHAHGVSYSP